VDPMLMSDGGPDSYWDVLWGHLQGALPGVGVALACLIISVLLSFKHARPGVIASVAFALMLAGTLVNVAANSWVTWRTWSGEMFFEDARPWRIGISVLWWIFHAASLGLVTTAVFVGRRSAPEAPRDIPAPVRGDARTDASSGAPPTAPPGPRAESGPGPGPDQRISKPLYLASIFGSVLLTFVLMIPAIVLLVQQDEDLIPAALGVFCFAYLPVIYSIVMSMVLVYKLWATIQDAGPRTTPGRAVGFLFIPFFSLYWVFRVYPGFAAEFNAYIRDRGIDARPVSEGLGIAVCIVALAAMIPYVGILIGLANIVLMWLFYAQAIDGVNAVRAARRAVR